MLVTDSRCYNNLCFEIKDDSLAAILKDFLPKQVMPPGVPSENEALPWPFVQSPRSAPASGGDYLISRRALLGHYASRWLLAIHDMDLASYGRLLYELSFDIALDAINEEVSFSTPQSTDDADVRHPSNEVSYHLIFSSREWPKYLIRPYACFRS